MAARNVEFTPNSNQTLQFQGIQSRELPLKINGLKVVQGQPIPCERKPPLVRTTGQDRRQILRGPMSGD